VRAPVLIPDHDPDVTERFPSAGDLPPGNAIRLA
jgi:hypothetical protein